MLPSFKQLILALGLFLALPNSIIFSQVIGQLKWEDTIDAYLVSVSPNQTLTAPNNITNSGQITLKAKKNSLKISSIQNHNGEWQLIATINTPIEAPEYDYFVFGLTNPMFDPQYMANEAFPLFSFKNTFDCLGSVELIENFVDEFWPPNSLNANIGNQLTIFSFGIRNAYHENDLNNAVVECPQKLKYTIQIDSIKCHGEEAAINLYFEQGQFPIRYIIESHDQNIAEHQISSPQEIVQHLLPSGDYFFNIFNDHDTLQEIIQLDEPLPFKIEVISQDSLQCDDADGVRIELGVENSHKLEDYQFNWSDGQKGPIASGLQEGTYNITVSDEKNCEETTSINVSPPPPMTIHSIGVNQDTVLRKGQSHVLIPSISYDDFFYYEWQPTTALSCYDCAMPTVFLDESTVVTLTVTNEWGCQATYEQLIEVIDNIPIYIPTAFSPNGDGINDTFQIYLGPTVKAVNTLVIYDRWGQLVFEATSNNQNSSPIWDGSFRNQLVASGIYLYVAQIILVDGKIITKKGDFSVLK